ncbi:MAG: 4-hydroxy-3-methylbut-2-enyl diphosphate reductase [Bacteroidales bacterium]|nr:4-hydroxy-3-methylbut-2-enyl diphosphate reductase [Bacteroidales bacterium]
MKVTVNENSGFCFGVVNAIKTAEVELEKSGKLYCLGDIVHNAIEVKRLAEKGLEIIDHKKFKKLKSTKVLIRAHGEPPETYKIAKENNVELIDASCKVVLSLQENIKNEYKKIKDIGGQIVIYGKKDHPEVIGLNGQINNNAIIIESPEDIDKIDFEKPVSLFAQTTKSIETFYKIKDEIKNKIKNNNFTFQDSICRQVANRATEFKEFAIEHEVLIFVSGKKSSNGKFLFGVCKSVKPETYFVSEISEIKREWFTGKSNVGICGATSTPRWLMEKVAEIIEKF